MTAPAAPSTERSSIGRGGSVLVREYSANVPAPRPGDVVFGNRLSAVQRLNTLSGDSLTHGGVLVLREGSLHVAELGARGCFFRPLEDFQAAYRMIGIGHSRMSDLCRERVAARALEIVEEQQLRYSWTNVGLAGTMALARRLVPESVQPAWIRASTRVAGRILDRIDEQEVTCSGLVAHCWSAACDNCRPYLAWPVRPRVRPWRGATTPTDARRAECAESVVGRVAAALSTPSDLWVATIFPVRTVIGHRSTVVLIDRSLTAHAQRGACLSRVLQQQPETSQGGVQ